MSKLLMDIIEKERNMIQQKLKKLPHPFFIRGRYVVVSKNDEELMVKLLYPTISQDREGRWQTHYFKIIQYFTEEEYAWLKILLREDS